MQFPSLFSVVPAIVNSGLNLLGVDVSAEFGTSGSTAGDVPDRAVTAPSGRVDFTSISPDDFSAWLKRQHQTGALSDQAYNDLSALRLEFDRRRVPRDEPLDLVDLLRTNAGSQPTSWEAMNTGAAELARRQLQWLEKFARGNEIDELA